MRGTQNMYITLSTKDGRQIGEKNNFFLSVYLSKP